MLTIDALALCYGQWKGWIENPNPQGAAPPQGLTNTVVFKGTLYEFETFDVVPGNAPTAFPIGWLFSGVFNSVERDGLSGLGSLVPIIQNLSPVNDLNLEAAWLGDVQEGAATLRYSPAGVEGRDERMTLDLLELHLTLHAAVGMPPAVTLSGMETNGGRAEVVIGSLTVPAVI